MVLGYPKGSNSSRLIAKVISESAFDSKSDIGSVVSENGYISCSADK